MDKENFKKAEIRVFQLKDLVGNNGQIEGLPKNPRIVKNERYEQMKQSLIDDPEMLSLRELWVREITDGKDKGKWCVISGNLRLKALKELSKDDEKYSQVPCKIVPADMPIGKVAAFIIKDNGTFGKWNFDMLANDWDEEILDKYGIDMSLWQVKEQDFDDTNQEIDVDDFDEDMALKIKITPDALAYVNEKLAGVNENKDTALLTVMGWYDEIHDF